MNKRFTTLALMILAAGAPSFAESPYKDFYIKGGFASPQGDSRDMTRKSKGFTFEGGYVVTPTLWPGLVRFYVGYVKMGGDENYKPWITGSNSAGNFSHASYEDYAALTDTEQSAYTIKEASFAYDMTGHTFGVDFVFPIKIGEKNFSIFTGPALTQWYMVKINPKQPQSDKNVKTGWRLGVTYNYDEHLDFSAAFTQTEWQSSSTQPFEQGANPSRPSYLSLTAGYRF